MATSTAKAVADSATRIKPATRKPRTRKAKPINALTQAQQATVDDALDILASRLTRTNVVIHATSDVVAYCSLKLSSLAHEVFAVMFLDNRHQMIKFEVMFRGTIDSAPIYPREVAKEALACNAAAVVLSHNHPSGIPDPSKADVLVTDRLTSALHLLDIRVIDHIIVGAGVSISFAERGLL